MQSAVIYCRVSSESQVRDGYGLQSQELSCREYAERKGYTIARVFKDEAVSGGDAIRQGWNELVVHCIQNPGTIVIFYDNSRLARDVSIAKEFAETIEKTGCSLEFMNFDYKPTASGKFMFNVLSSVSEYFRVDNKEKTLSRMKIHLQNGVWQFGVPTGYKRGAKRVIVEDQPAFNILQTVLKKYARGNYTTLAEAHRAIKDLGLKITYKNLQRITQNIFYTGYFELLSWDVPLTKGQHPAMFSMEEHELIKSRNQRTYVRSQREEFWIKDICHCESCNHNLTGNYSRGKQGKLYQYYWCPNRSCELYRKNISKFRIMEKLKEDADVISEWAIKNHTEILEVIQEQYDAYIKEMKGKQEMIQGSINQIEGKIKSMVHKMLYVAESTSIKIFEEEIKKLEEEKSSLQNTLHLQNCSNPSEMKNALEKYLHLCHNFAGFIEKADGRLLVDIMTSLFKEGYSISQSVPTLKKSSILLAINDQLIVKSKLGSATGN